ncbi:MAG: T9SS type A sorting domain-containing protein [Melioribacteraceae bacterium]
MNLKKLVASLFAVLLFTVVFAGTANAQTTYYVDGVAGNDSWTGTAATFQSGNVGPKKTIQAMVDASANLDIIEIAAATYNETVTLSRRTQLKPTGAILVQNLILNTGSSTAVELGNTAGNSLTVTGTLTVQSGQYNLTNAGQVALAAGATYELYVAGASAAMTTNAVAGVDANYTLKFLNTSALTTNATDLPTNNPKDIFFNGSAAVTLGAGLIAKTGDLTIALGASVNVVTFTLEVQGGDFTNDGSYYGTTGKVQMTTTGNIISGSGNFQNLELNGAFTWKLGSNLSFTNVDQATASLINVAVGTLDFRNFNISTPGSVTIAGAIAYSGTGATSPGVLEFSGSLGTIGTVTFTIPGAGLTVKNLSITKPSGSTVALAGGNLTVDNQLNFTGGIFNIGVNNLALSNNHAATAAIGGNINGTGGTFTVGGGALANDITVSGAGQINTPFVVDAAAKTVTFTQLTTVGSNLTLTSGNLTTSSLQLINGTITLTAGNLTFNTSNLSVTNAVTINGGALKGSSNITISGAITHNAGAVNMTGTLTAASYATDGSAGNFAAGTTSTGAGAFNVNGSAGSTYDITGNFTSGALTTSTGAFTVTGNTTTAAAALGGDLTTVDFSPSGALTFGAASVLTVSGNFTGGSTVNFTNATSAAVTGNFSAAGTVTMSVANVTVGGNFTISGSGNDFVGAAGNLTVTGVASIADDVILNAGTTTFNGTGTYTFGGKITSGTTFGTLTVSGPANVADYIQPLHDGTMTFKGLVTMTGADAANDIKMDAVTVGAATINFNGGLIADDVLIDGSFANTINFTEGTGLTSQINDLTFIANIAVTVPKIVVGGATAGKSHALSISGDITVADPNALVTVNSNGRIKLNGTGDLQTFANAQTIALSAAIPIANLEVANTGTDSDTSLDGGGNGATTDETKESVTITGFALTVTNLYLTSNGINGTNLTLNAAGASVTRTAGAINIANQTAVGQVTLTYNNPSAMTTGSEYTVSAGGTIEDLNVNGAGKLTLSGAGSIDGDLVIATGAELANATFAVTVGAAEGANNTAKVNVNGTFSGTGKLIVDVNDASAYTVKGTGGSISNLEFDFVGADGTVVYAGPGTLTGNLTSLGGANGTITYSATAPATIGGNFTVNVKALNVAGDLAVTGNFTHTAATTTLSGALNVTGNYSQAAGTVNIFATKDVTVTGNYTSTGGIISFPAASTSSFIIKGATNSTAGPTTYTFNPGSSGRIVFNGAAAQTLTLGNNTTIARMQLNTPLGMTMSGVAVNLTVNNLLLTAGTFTHNGLLTMPGATDRIVRDAGALASFAAAGPGEVEYVGTTDITTGYEIVNLMNKVVVNAASGNPNVTLDKNVTILTNGELNLSRGTLVVGSNALIMQNTTTVIRAEGAISGTPTYGTPTTLKYFNTQSDLTTGGEFTNDGNITALEINAPGKKVMLGGNVRVAGTSAAGVLDVQVLFGTLEVGANTLTVSGDFVNNGTVTTTTGKILVNGTSIFSGSTVTWPTIDMNAAGLNLTFAPTVDESDLIFGTFTLTDGNVLFAANPNNPNSVTFNGDFTVAKNADNFSDANVTGSVYFNTNFTNRSNNLTQGRTWVFSGTVNQTIYSVDEAPATPATFALNNVTVNNDAGVTLGSDLLIANASTLTMTKGNITTGSNKVQLGTTANSPIVRTAGMIVGNIWAAVNTDPVAATDKLFPVGTGTNYRPLTLTFGPVTGGTNTFAMAKVSHASVTPAGVVGLPLTSGGVTINKLSPMNWTVGFYNPASTADLFTPLSNPKVKLGAGGYSYGDITKIRALYRLTDPQNTWLVPGTFDQSFYDMNGVPTVVHSGVQGWALEAQQIFTIGFNSTFAVANALTDQTLIVGGTAYTKDVTTVFTGNAGTVTYSVASLDVTKATAAMAGAVLTVTAVAEGTSTITVTATDANGEQKTSSFVATIQAKPTFTLPTPATFTIAEAATTNNTVVFAASGTAGITYSMVPNTPALTWAAFDAATATLTLTPGYGVAAAVTGGVYTITIRATGTNGLFTDFVLTVTVTTTLRSPVWTGTGSATIATKSIKYNEVFNFSYIAVDPDGTALTYSLESVNPATTSAVFTNNTGLGGFGQLVFTPTAADAGVTYTIVVKALNANGLSSTTTTVLTVGTNSAPVFTKVLPDSTVKVHNVAVPVVFQYVANDVDGDLFTWTLISGKGSISTTGLYTWTPVAADKGTTNTVKVRITDVNNPLIYTETSAVLTVENVITSVESIDGVPTTYALAQNYPNPFNPSTNIQFSIPTSSNVKLTIFNILGEEIAVLVNGYMNAGNYKVTFNASNLPSGLYLYRIQSENFTQVKKMLLMK